MKEPIAIIGIGCRYPGGVNDTDSFWAALIHECEMIREVPRDRFDLDTYYDPTPATPGKVMSRWGGYLDAIDHFDAGFFGISPREAARLDPQQRLLLEVAWEALEDAGQLPDTPAVQQTGVFVGMWLNDFEARLFEDPANVDFYMTTGSGRYSASGRLSYAFGLQGPSMTIDSACSSSLVAVHLAVQSLRSGECNLALAGGANVILQPQITIAYSQSKMMAPDGHCKFGDAAADGYVRSEGAGMIVLKRLSDALADGDPIYAVIRGSAVNNDGKSSGFLATPGSAGQEEMLRKAYADADVSPGAVQYVEAHGTGTNAGDPVEIGALGTVLATDRPDGRPCMLGSVKTNFGHTEGAAGVAGLIKVALSLQHQMLPASLHFKQPSPKIAWDQFPVRIQGQLTAWPEHEGAAIAGVSSFGIAGTNAHIVLQEAPFPSLTDKTRKNTYVLPLSARNLAALKELAGTYRDRLTEGGLHDTAYTASMRRTPHDYRLSVAGSSAAELARQLDAYLKDEANSGVRVRQVDPDVPLRVVFVFPGQGGQWVGMARQLLTSEPVFREAIEACEAAIQPLVNWSLQVLLTSDEMAARFEEIDIVQPALFAIQVALAALWRSWGVEPDAILGHSLGEVAGAYVAGVLSLKDAAQVICHRSRLMKTTSGKGAMAVVGLSLEQTTAVLKGYEGRLSIAVSNSPHSTVIAGEPQTLEKVLEALRMQNVFCRLVKVDVASHSSQMEPLRPELVKALNGLTPHAGNLPIYSTVDGVISDGGDFDAEYWGRNLRQPVLFAKMVEKLLADEHTIFIELSPHPILLSPIEDTLHDLNRVGYTIPSMLRQKNDHTAMFAALGALYTVGYPVNWAKLYPEGGAVVKLPTYPWQRQHYWIETTKQNGWTAKGGDPLIGQRLPDLAHLPGHHFWEKQVDAGFQRYVNDHFAGELNNDAYAAMALNAANAVYGEKGHSVDSFTVHAPLIIDGIGKHSLQIILTDEDRKAAAFQIFSRESEDAQWSACASGSIQIAQMEAGWLYKHIWQPQPRQDTAPSDAPGHWLIFTDKNGLGAQLAHVVTQRGGRATLIVPGEAYGLIEDEQYCINPTQAQDFARLLAEVGQDTSAVVYLWAEDALPDMQLDTNRLHTLQSFFSESTLYLAQALAGQKFTTPRLWLVTWGAQAVIEANAEAVNATQTALWGFGRVMSIEHPDLWGGLIDLPENGTQTDEAKILFSEIAAFGAEDQIAFRDGQRFVLRFVHDDVIQSIHQPMTITDDGTYLITGGFGSLGLVFARWLVENGARHVVLTGRRGATEGALPVLTELETLGAEVVAASVDAANFDDMKRLLDDIGRNMPPLRGIIHAAGVLDACMLVQQTPERFNSLIAPKIFGASHLHTLTQHTPLDFFVMFSSVSSAMGLGGESAYAAGNAYLEGLAQYRRARGLPVLTISWGAWDASQFKDGVGELIHLLGLNFMADEPALAAMVYLLQTGAVCETVADIDWDTFRRMHETHRGQPLFEHIGITTSSDDSDGVEQKANFAQVLRDAPADQRWAELVKHIRDEVAGVLGFDATTLDLKAGFFKIGMDSLMSVQLRNRLEASLACLLPPTIVLEYPSIEMLAGYITHDVFKWNDNTEEDQTNKQPAVTTGTKSDFDGLSDDELMFLLDAELAKVDDLTGDE